MRGLSRRRFCLELGAGGAIGLTAAGAFRAGGCPQAVTRSAYALGCEATITVLHNDTALAHRALAAAFAELNVVEAAMSLYRPESQLVRLNRQAWLDDPHPYLADILDKSRAISEQTDGAFDITVQPLWRLYADAHRQGRLPDAASIKAERRKADWRRVEITTGRIELRGAGMAVTLNGIAQGYAADRAMDALKRHGIEHALVNTGEIASLGRKEGGQPWSAGIQHPRDRDAYLAVVEPGGRCLATSGDYATTFSADYHDHHIFDPRTGHSPETLASVSVAAPTAWRADALSTAVFVLGPGRGLQLLRATPGVDALLVMKDGRTLATDGFPRSIS